ncbi:MAG: hypothetical protein EXS10_09045 [Phycisphaerales bacterium]|nr:hypothetical protein [Phycisphaerales bacterium]
MTKTTQKTTRNHTFPAYRTPAILAVFAATATLSTACNTLTQTRTEVVAPQSSIASTNASSTAATLAAWLTGSYSTHAQAIADPSFHDLHLEIVPCWTDRADGPWLYFEQSSAATIDKPYKQRVYKLIENLDTTITMLVFELPNDPLSYALAWKLPRPLNDLTPELLNAQDGCAMSMTIALNGTSATGGSEGTHCPSTYAGAAYSTVELIVSADRLQLWERGFDAKGTIVTGSRTGPCEFMRIPQTVAAVAIPVFSDTLSQK